MNIVNKLTLRHLKQNKRRTLVTIIGVIISVAMVTAVASLGVSFMDLMQRKEIASGGEWHVLYKNVNKDQLETIKKDKDSKTVVISRDRGYAVLANSKNENKPYLFIKEYNAQGFKQFPIELSEGRLPKATNEVVLTEHIATNAKVEYKIGDHLTLDIGQRFIAEGEGSDRAVDQNDSFQFENGKSIETLKNKTTANYTVVGFIKRPDWEPAWSPGYTVLTYLDENSIGTNEPVNASVVLKKVKSPLFKHAEDLAKKIKIESPQFNNSLLRYYGVMKNDNTNQTLLQLSAIIMAVIIIGSVSLIYNAFAISVSERSRHLGMLSSVGATKRQKRNSVFFEGIIIGLISIPLGIIAGLAGIGITFLCINSIIQNALELTESLTVKVTPLSILIACAVSIVTIFISTYLPAIRASRVTAIDAIRQTTDVKLTGKAVKTSKLIRKLFGFEAEIGLKNLKRNKRKYQATVFSLVISIVLFLTVSFFTDNLKKSLALTQENVSYDIQVSTGGEFSKTDEQLLKSFASLEDVTESSEIKEIDMDSWINRASIADEIKKGVYKADIKNGKFAYIITLHALNEQNLKAYAKTVGTDYEKLKNEKHLSGIVIDTIPFKDEVSRKYVETKVIHTKVGESIDLIYTDPDTEKEVNLNKVEVAALTNQLPMGISPYGIGGLNIIVSEQVMDHLLIEKLNDRARTYLYLNSKDPMKTQQEIEKIKENNMYVYNVYQNRQQEEQTIMLMSVFTYGFIALITAISIANIFNTISTSISLRKREFAMLKSVGMTPKGFTKMINYESMFYGIKSLLFGLPISIIIMYLIHRTLMNSFSYGFTLPWLSIIYVIAAVFVIVGSAMLYSSSKVKKENIIDALKQENI